MLSNQDSWKLALPYHTNRKWLYRTEMNEIYQTKQRNSKMRERDHWREKSLLLQDSTPFSHQRPSLPIQIWSHCLIHSASYGGKEREKKNLSHIRLEYFGKRRGERLHFWRRWDLQLEKWTSIENLVRSLLHSTTIQLHHQLLRFRPHELIRQHFAVSYFTPKHDISVS